MATLKFNYFSFYITGWGIRLKSNLNFLHFNLLFFLLLHYHFNFSACSTWQFLKLFTTKHFSSLFSKLFHFGA